MIFLTDSQTNQRFVEILQKLEWDVRTAYEESLAGKAKDYLLVIRANQLKRTLITFDELAGESGALVARELRTYGGKVLRIMGGPEQPPYRALGKLLFHHENWYPFLDTHDGVVVISDTKQSCRLYTPEMYHQTYHQTDAKQFEDYLAKRKEKVRHSRHRRQKTISKDQPPMF